MVVGSIPEGFETVDLMYKGGELLVRANMTVVDTGTGEAPEVYVVLFLDVMVT